MYSCMYSYYATRYVSSMYSDYVSSVERRERMRGIVEGLCIQCREKREGAASHRRLTIQRCIVSRRVQIERVQIEPRYKARIDRAYTRGRQSLYQVQIDGAYICRAPYYLLLLLTMHRRLTTYHATRQTMQRARTRLVSIFLSIQGTIEGV